MGWKPNEVRAATLFDFDAAFEGWRMANGAADDELTTDDLEEHEALMARYPDKAA